MQIRNKEHLTDQQIDCKYSPYPPSLTQDTRGYETIMQDS